MRDIGTMPPQRIPLSKKTKEWREACVDHLVGNWSLSMSGEGGRTKDSEIQINYDLYNGVYNEKDLKYVTNPFKQLDGFPANPQNYNIIKPKIDLLLGEETKRPFNFRVTRTSEAAASELQETMKQMLIQYSMALIMSRMGEEEAAQFQAGLESGEIMPPEEIQRYISKDYKDIIETSAQHILNYSRSALNLDHVFFKGWKDALIAGKEFFYVGVQNGKPIVERVNPLYIAHDNSLDLEFIDEGDWVVRKMIMSYTEVYDRLWDKLTDKQLRELQDLIDSRQNVGWNSELRKTNLDYPHYKMRSIDGNVANPFWDINDIEVYHVCWKSYKKIGWVTFTDPETGEIETLEVDETYKENGTELDIEWSWIIEVWEGWRIGADPEPIYAGIQPVEYQHISADNPNARKLPYTGVLYNQTNSPNKSLVSILKPLQYMYIIVWYRLELAMARDKGKVLTIDITQIPKSMNIDVSKWMHYLSALGVNFINPYEEGWDIPGREGGKASQFNQITALDLTMANIIDQYIMLMAKIEQMASDISGITKQREGAISQNELVGNVLTSVNQSAHITEPMFWMHNQVKRRVLTMLLDTSKGVWKDSDRTILHYIFDDSTRIAMNIPEEFSYEDFDIFVDDSTKTQQQIEALKQLLQPAMQNGASILDAAEVITMDNITMIKNKLQDIEEARQQQQMEAEQRAAEQQQQLVQMENEVREQELMLKEAELELQKYKIDQDNATKITVAELQAYRGRAELDQNGNGIPDPMEIAEAALAQRRQDAEEADRDMEQSNKRREIDFKKEIENKKIALEKEKLAAQERIQKQKDKAAMEREQLKAKTALKNKVVGER